MEDMLNTFLIKHSIQLKMLVQTVPCFITKVKGASLSPAKTTSYSFLIKLKQLF